MTHFDPRCPPLKADHASFFALLVSQSTTYVIQAIFQWYAPEAQALVEKAIIDFPNTVAPAFRILDKMPPVSSSNRNVTLLSLLGE